MSEQLSPVLVDRGGGHVSFLCPGCSDHHVIRIGGEGSGPKWGYNGNPAAPTFKPSILVRSGHYVPGHAGDQCYCTWDRKDQDEFADLKCGICHSFVTDGRIRFLPDSTHELAGQTVDLPEYRLP